MPSSSKVDKDEIDSLFHINLTLNHLNKGMERRFKLSLVQLFVLLRLRTLPASCSQALSEAIGIQPSTLTQTIRRLVRKEYIFVTDDPRDSRKRLISLTRKGKEITEEVYQDLKEIVNNLEGNVKDTLEESLHFLSQVKEEIARA